MRTVSSFVLCLCLSFWSGGLQAQDRSASEKLNTEARTAYDKGDFQAALASFVRAWETFPDARYLYNAGKACTRLKDTEAALYFYERFLSLEKGDRDAKKLGREKVALEKSLKRKGLLPVTLDSDPAGAGFKIDGKEHPYLNQTPIRRWLKPGKYKITFSKKGYEDLELSLSPKDQPQTKVVLKKKAKTQKLTASCRADKQPCHLTLDGKKAEKWKSGEVLSLAEGRHVLQFGADGYAEKTVEFQARNGQKDVLAVILVQQPPKKAEKKLPAKAPDSAWSVRETAGYVLLGVGGAAVITGAVLFGMGAEKMSSADDDYHAKKIGYSAYRSRFSDGRSFAETGLWTSGLGALGAAGGAALLFLFPTDSGLASIYPSWDGRFVGIMAPW